MTNLLGRRVRSRYTGRNPKYDENAKRNTPEGEYWIKIPVDGDVVAIAVIDNALRLFVLDVECCIRECRLCDTVVLPRDHVGELR